MTTKKSSKSAPKKEVVPETPPVPVKTPSVIRPAAVEQSDYACGKIFNEYWNTSRSTIAPHVCLGKRTEVLTVATVSQWKNAV